MLLLIMCRDLEVTHRRMTTAITLVFAQTFVPGAAALVWSKGHLASVVMEFSLCGFRHLARPMVGTHP